MAAGGSLKVGQHDILSLFDRKFEGKFLD